MVNDKSILGNILMTKRHKSIGNSRVVYVIFVDKQIPLKEVNDNKEEFENVVATCHKNTGRRRVDKVLQNVLSNNKQQVD